MSQDLRCSTFSRDINLDPIGTAGCYSGFLLVEWPLPWPPDIADVPELSRVAEKAKATGYRLQALVGDSFDRATVICYSKAPGPFRTFLRTEVTVANADVIETALELIPSSGPRVHEVPAGPAARDVLICTHGSRDRCCGTLGMQLFQSVIDDPLEGIDTRDGITRFWRTSHTGGHRFAPNVIVLPEGTVWGYADRMSLARVLSRTEPPGPVLHGYRGCAAHESYEAQIIERAALADLGWGALDATRSSVIERWKWNDEVAELSPDKRRSWSKVTFDLDWREGELTHARFSAEVGVGRELPLPTCGFPAESSGATQTEFSIRNLTRVE